MINLRATDEAIERAHSAARYIEQLLPLLSTALAQDSEIRAGLHNAVYVLRRVRNTLEIDALDHRWDPA